jgi:hypothetical protein
MTGRKPLPATRNATHVGEIVGALNEGGFPSRLLSSTAVE